MKPTLPAVLLVLLLWGLSCPHAHAQSDLARTLGPAESKRAFSDVPLNDPAYACVNALKNAGIAVNIPPGTMGSRSKFTGYEFAVATVRPIQLLTLHLADVPKDQQKDLQQLQQETQDKLQKNPKAATALLALISEFEPEILALHQDVAGAK